MPQSYGAVRRRTAGTKLAPPEKSPTEKGYDSKWRRASEAFRRANPFCKFCLELDRHTLVVTGRTGVVDHKRPVEDGGEFWSRSNWQSLCNEHHGGLKRLLENEARRTGQLDQLALWCDDPSSRPVLRGDIQ